MLSIDVKRCGKAHPNSQVPQRSSIAFEVRDLKWALNHPSRTGGRQARHLPIKMPRTQSCDVASLQDDCPSRVIYPGNRIYLAAGPVGAEAGAFAASEEPPCGPPLAPPLPPRLPEDPPLPPRPPREGACGA